MIVLANLKPRNMCGVKSNGMLMAASDAAHENVELLVPPEGAVAGDRVWFGSIDEKDILPDVASPNQASLLSIFILIANGHRNQIAIPITCYYYNSHVNTMRQING